MAPNLQQRLFDRFGGGNIRKMVERQQMPMQYLDQKKKDEFETW